MSTQYKIEWVDNAGNLQGESITDPDGWENVQIVLRRSDELVGVFHEFLTNFTFYREGYERIKQIYNDIGLSAKLWVEFDSAGLTFRGVWEPESLSFDDELCTATVDFRRDDKVQKFLSRLNKKVDVMQDTHSVNGEHELSNWERKSVVVDPLPERSVEITSQFAVEQQQQEGGTSVSSGQSVTSLFAYTEVVVGEIEDTQASDHAAPGAIPFDVYNLRIERQYNSFRVKGSVVVRFENNATGTTVDRDVTFRLTIKRVDENNFPIEASRTLYELISLNRFSPGLLINEPTINIDEVFTNVGQTGAAEERFLIFAENTTVLESSQSDWNAVHLVRWTNLDINYIATPVDVVSPYRAKGIIINEMLATIVESISDGELTFKSDYYSDELSEPIPGAEKGHGSQRLLMSGFGIRDFPNPKLITTMREAFESLDAIDNIAMAIEGNNVVIEPKSAFLDNQNMSIELTNIPNITREIRTDLIVTGLEIGYQQWDAGFTIGLNEHCSTRSYILKGHDYKELIKTKLSPYIASGTILELVRRKPWRNFANEDTEHDNDVFIVDLEQVSGVYGVNPIVRHTQDIDNIDNIIDPESVYNLLLSPATNAARQLKTVMAATLSINEELLFRAGEGNTIARHRFIGDDRCPAGLIVENMDFDRESFQDQCGDILYKPEQMTFNAPLSVAKFNALRKSTRHAIIINGVKGYIDEIEFSPNSCMAEFQVLLSQSESDVTKAEKLIEDAIFDIDPERELAFADGQEVASVQNQNGDGEFADSANRPKWKDLDVGSKLLRSIEFEGDNTNAQFLQGNVSANALLDFTPDKQYTICVAVFTPEGKSFLRQFVALDRWYSGMSGSEILHHIQAFYNDSSDQASINAFYGNPDQAADSQAFHFGNVNNVPATGEIGGASVIHAFDGGSFTSARVRSIVNGQQIAQNLFITGGFAEMEQNASSNVYINRTFSGFGGYGFLCRWVVFGRALSNDEMQIIHNYFRAKYHIKNPTS